PNGALGPHQRTQLGQHGWDWLVGLGVVERDRAGMVRSEQHERLIRLLFDVWADKRTGPGSDDDAIRQPDIEWWFRTGGWHERRNGNGRAGALECKDNRLNRLGELRRGECLHERDQLPVWRDSILHGELSCAEHGPR